MGNDMFLCRTTGRNAELEGSFLCCRSNGCFCNASAERRNQACQCMACQCHSCGRVHRCTDYPVAEKLLPEFGCNHQSCRQKNSSRRSGVLRWNSCADRCRSHFHAGKGNAESIPSQCDCRSISSGTPDDFSGRGFPACLCHQQSPPWSPGQS